MGAWESDAKVSQTQSASKAVQKLVDRLRSDVHNLVSLLLMQQTPDGSGAEQDARCGEVDKSGDVLFKN